MKYALNGHLICTRPPHTIVRNTLTELPRDNVASNGMFCMLLHETRNGNSNYSDVSKSSIKLCNKVANGLLETNQHQMEKMGKKSLTSSLRCLKNDKKKMRGMQVIFNAMKAPFIAPIEYQNPRKKITFIVIPPTRRVIPTQQCIDRAQPKTCFSLEIMIFGDGKQRCHGEGVCERYSP